MENAFRTASKVCLKSSKVQGVYVHIPFCKERCLYCDFLTFPHANSLHASYTDALIREITKRGKGVLCDTLYIGGGSPLEIDAKLLDQIFSAIDANLSFLPAYEKTLEGNPGDFTQEKLRILQKYGINRVSLGIQSTQPDVLRDMRRRYDVQTVHDDVGRIRDFGITNINFDFIYGFPGQTVEDLKEDFRLISDLEPSHISWYALIYEEKSLLYHKDHEKPDSITEERMWEEILAFLSSQGYERYEISNFAKPGFQSRHNLKYWEGKDYLGLGLGASSYLCGERYKNPERFADYAISGPVREERSLKEDRFEQIMMGLRKISGIARRSFEKKNGLDVLETAKSFYEQKRREGMCAWDADHFYLTDMGLRFQNQFLLELMDEML